MMLLVTFPGRYGDLAWALPTIRAISRRIGSPVDLLIAGEFAPIVPLLELQPYLARVYADPLWALNPGQREAPRGDVISPYDATIHLGFRGWPDPDVVRHTMETFNAWSRIEGSKWTRLGILQESELDLQTPWITVAPPPEPPDALVIAFTEVHFELKVGLTLLMLEQFARKTPDLPYAVVTVPNGRWKTDLWQTWRAMKAEDWLGYAKLISRAKVVLADCSGAHVLAVAMGVPVLLMEPLEARHNPVFYPLGTVGPQVRLITGNDGKPTFDVRHVFDAVEAALNATH